MKRLLLGLVVLPFVASGALAGQPLTDQQMDRVTAGFDAFAQAGAEGLVGESGLLTTTTATLAQITPFQTVTYGELSLTVYKSVAAAQSSSVTSTVPTATLTGVGD